MNQDILDKIKLLKMKYEPEGFIILGVFGSYSRGEETEESDLDILYDLTHTAYEKYPGMRFFAFYEKIKTDIRETLNIPVDLADIGSLKKIGEKYLLPEVVYVS